MMRVTDGNPDNGTLAAFVNRNFGPEGTEFQEWTPEDWKEDPAVRLQSKL